MMLSAMGLEKTPRRALSGVLGILQTAVRDAIFISKALPQKPLQPALRKQTQHPPAPSVWNVCWRSTILLMC